MLRIFAVFLPCFWSLPIYAASGHYQYQGRPIAFTYEAHLVAQPLPKGSTDIQSQDSFAAMGFRLVENKSASAKLLPVWFASGSVGVLKNRIAVRFKDQVTSAVWLSQNVVTAVNYPSYHAQLVYLETIDAVSAITLANDLAGDDRVQYAHPLFHFPIEARSPVDEPLFSEQWHLENTGQRGGTPGSDLNVRGAWQRTQGNAIVGLIDLGFEQDHPDLQDAWLLNTGEIAGNRRDDDGNGLIDDVRGWNFDTNGNNLLYGSASSHGTATAGLIAAPANGIGVTGVCPGCKVLPIVIYSDVEDAVAAFYYARDRGASVISNSWGYRIGTPETDLLTEALTDIAVNARDGKGVSILFAMPNFGSDACRPGNPDISAHPHVIAVSSVDFHDKKVAESGFGACLKFVGPTSASQTNALVTTDRVGDRGYNSASAAYAELADRDYTQSFYGTSAATPAVAGVMALMYSLKPDLIATDALQILVDTATRISPNDADYNAAGFSEIYGYGRPDATQALLGVSHLR